VSGLLEEEEGEIEFTSSSSSSSSSFSSVPSHFHCLSRHVIHQFGGGLYIWDSATVTLISCSISDNTASAVSYLLEK